MRGQSLVRAALAVNAALSGTCSVLLLGWIALRSSMPIAWVRVITMSDAAEYPDGVIRGVRT